MSRCSRRTILAVALIAASTLAGCRSVGDWNAADRSGTTGRDLNCPPGATDPACLGEGSGSTSSAAAIGGAVGGGGGSSR